MLPNAYVLANIGFDTAGNEPWKNTRHSATSATSAQPRSSSAPCSRPSSSRCAGARSRSRTAAAVPPENVFFENAFFENAFFENFANFWRARSRLYQNEFLQENMRSTSFFKLYKICILLHRCNLKIFAKNRFEKTAIFVKIQQKKCESRKICKNLSNFKNFSLRIW